MAQDQKPKPDTDAQYRKWLLEEHRCALSEKQELYYESTCARIRSEIAESVFWKDLWAEVLARSEKYLVETKYDLLLTKDEPHIFSKPYASVVDKSFRMNVHRNRNWPRPPANDWVFPNFPFGQVNDLVRTSIVVKYLDGVQIIQEAIESYSKALGYEVHNHYEAREDGYYACHIYITHAISVPTETWETKIIPVKFEVQITTQLQDVIRKLIHKYYVEKRSKKVGAHNTDWKWDYESEEFATNYLGHILHFLEGVIVEIRNKQRGSLT
ncbi:MAG TPA: hypothetical protein VGT99_11200 [Gammaproteobacteria bacterium]|nr:hypothetical protein [Gammaproteobacteria bacterium]